MTVTFSTDARRKARELPVYLMVPTDVAQDAALTETVLCEVALTAGARWQGMRSIKPWPERGWFLELNAEICRRAQIRVGSSVAVELLQIDVPRPAELDAILEARADARAHWDTLSKSRQRMLIEHVLTARRASTRQRRVEEALIRRRW